MLAWLDGGAAERYALGPVIGAGGMGQVVEARDQDLGRLVAMKRAGATRQTEAQARQFLVEAQITGQLDHQGIPPVHELGVGPDGSAYYTMKLVRGGTTLRAVMDALEAGDAGTTKSFSLERRVRIVQQVAHALHYAHSKGVVHRDVKPENIMLGPYGEVFLVDWGVATVVDTDEAKAEPVAPPSGQRQMARRVAGTPAYMAPEQAVGDASPRSDIYSLCAVLFELITGRHFLDEPPSSATEVLETAAARAGEPVTCRRRGPALPALRRICGRGLSVDPAARFESAAALEQALQGWLEGRAHVTCPTTFAVRVLRAWTRALEERPRLATLLTYGSIVLLIGGLALLGGAVTLGLP